MRRDLLGASALRQVLHGALLTHCLQVDAEIEVRIDKRWQVATITRIVYDGELARHIKVRSLHSIPSLLYGRRHYCYDW